MLQKEKHMKSSFKESVRALESHIQHANHLASAIQQDYGGISIQMKLYYGALAPILLFLVDWMDYSCTDSVISYLGLLRILVYQVYADGMPTISSTNRIATLREFYATIYPTLMQLEGDMMMLKEEKYKNKSHFFNDVNKKAVDKKRKLSGEVVSRDEECGICMEACTDVVLPKCGHSMCNNCFNDWNALSQSCPFCRDNLKRVGSGDLWFLTNKNDILDMVNLAKENIKHFFLYIENLPPMVPDTPMLIYEYLI